MSAYWVCAARETPTFSPNFRSGAYNFLKWPKIPVRSITIWGGGGGLRRPSFSPVHRLPRPAPERSAAPLISRNPHFHAQNGSSSVRSPAFSRSTVELGPEPVPIFHFAATHTYQNLKFGVSTTPPPPPQRHLQMSRILRLDILALYLKRKSLLWCLCWRETNMVLIVWHEMCRKWTCLQWNADSDARI